MKFKRQDLLDMDLPYSAEHEEFVEASRWELLYKIVFQVEGKYYQTTYRVGATENQWCEPWECQEEVECEEVTLKEVIVDTWVPMRESK